MSELSGAAIDTCSSSALDGISETTRSANDAVLPDAATHDQIVSRPIL
jgi:hypothetical protein